MDSITQFIAELQAPEPLQRLSAVHALGTLADPRAIEPLLAYLHDPNMKDAPAQDPGSSYLASQNFDPYYEAYGAYDEPIQVREAVVDALGEIGTSAVLEPLIDLLQKAEWNVQRKAADALGKIGDTRAVEPLIEALNYRVTIRSEISSVDTRAQIALGKLGDLRAVEPLLKRLPGQWAARSLGELGDLRAVAPLMAQAMMQDGTLSAVALEALGKLGDKQALDTVLHCLEDKYPLVRREAFVALGKIGKGDPDIAASLIHRFTHQQDAEERRYIIMALGRLGGEHALQFLTSLLRTGSREESLVAARWFIDFLVDPQAIPFLLPLLQEDNDVPGLALDRLRAAVAVALGRLHAVEAVEKILLLLQSKDRDSCGRAVYALGELGDPRAVDPLLHLLQSKGKGDLLAVCARSLGRLGDRRAIAPLRAALEQVDVRNISNRGLYRSIAKALAQLESSSDHTGER